MQTELVKFLNVDNQSLIGRIEKVCSYLEKNIDFNQFFNTYRKLMMQWLILLRKSNLGRLSKYLGETKWFALSYYLADITEKGKPGLIYFTSTELMFMFTQMYALIKYMTFAVSILKRVSVKSFYLTEYDKHKHQRIFQLKISLNY